MKVLKSWRPIYFQCFFEFYNPMAALDFSLKMNQHCVCVPYKSPTHKRRQKINRCFIFLLETQRSGAKNKTAPFVSGSPQHPFFTSETWWYLEPSRRRRLSWIDWLAIWWCRGLGYVSKTHAFPFGIGCFPWTRCWHRYLNIWWLIAHRRAGSRSRCCHGWFFRERWNVSATPGIICQGRRQSDRPASIHRLSAAGCRAVHESRSARAIQLCLREHQVHVLIIS